MYLVTKIQFIIVAMRGGGKSTSFPGFSPTRPSWERGWRESEILRVELSSWLQAKSVYYREHALMAESILDLGLYLTFFYSQGRSSVPHKILFMNWLFEKWIRLFVVTPGCQIQFGILHAYTLRTESPSTFLLSSEYVTRTSLYLDRETELNWANRA